MALTLRFRSQTCIVTHESNGIDIITALILNDISPLCRYRMEMVLQLKVRRLTCPGSRDTSWVSFTCAPYFGSLAPREIYDSPTK